MWFPAGGEVEPGGKPRLEAAGEIRRWHKEPLEISNVIGEAPPKEHQLGTAQWGAALVAPFGKVTWSTPGSLCSSLGDAK